MSADEVRRRFLHAAGAVFPALYLVDVVSWTQLQAIYLAGSALAIGLEAVRLVLEVEWRVFEQLTREYEASNPAGYALYTVSSTAVVVAFDPIVAVPAVLMLALGDPVSGVLATNEFHRPKRPTVMAAMFAVCAVIAIWFVPLVPAVLGALVATLADGFTPVLAGYVIDDNLSIPIGAASAMWVGLAWLPGLGL